MIRVGIGGWNFAPWRKTFYPKGLSHAKELSFASRALSTIEINATYYRNQKPATFRRWADETPDDFVFSVKATRFATNRRVLSEARESVERFLASGIEELGQKLGPILWQFAPTKKYEEKDFESFLSFLPRKLGGLPLRHAVEVRHESFCDMKFVALARKHKVAIVFADSAKYPAIADPTSDFVYLRLQQTKSSIPTGYTARDLQHWADDVQTFEKGGTPERLGTFGSPGPKAKRDVFAYMISGAKERAPAAAQELAKLLK